MASVFIKILLLLIGYGVFIGFYNLFPMASVNKAVKIFIWVNVGIIYSFLFIPFFLNNITDDSRERKKPSLVLLWSNVVLFIAFAIIVIFLTYNSVFSVKTGGIIESVVFFFSVIITFLGYAGSSRAGADDGEKGDCGGDEEANLGGGADAGDTGARAGAYVGGVGGVGGVGARADRRKKKAVYGHNCDNGDLNIVPAIQAAFEDLVDKSNYLPGDCFEQIKKIRRMGEEVKYLKPVKDVAAYTLEQQIMEKINGTSDACDIAINDGDLRQLLINISNLDMLIKQRRLMKSKK